MKLKLRDFYEMSKLVSPFPVDLALPLLKKMVKDLTKFMTKIWITIRYEIPEMDWSS